MADCIASQIEEIRTSENRPLAYSNLLQIYRFSSNVASSMQSLSLSMPPLIPILLLDIQSQDEEIAAMGLKCLGFMLYHPSLVPIFSEEDGGLVLETLAKLVMATRMKAICNLGVWCISIQQLGNDVVGSRMGLLLQATVHALDNPFGSLSTTFEATQAVTKMSTRFCEKMRDTANIWVPPIYRRLVSNDKKEKNVAERCLLKIKSIICPPSPSLSKAVALDLKKKLLPSMLGMAYDVQRKVPMTQAWGWYICLLGSSSLKNRHLINEMLKIPELTFTDHDAQVQIASLVAWEQLIDVLLPPQMVDLEMNCSDHVNGLLRSINVLIMPLKGIISRKCDISVHSTCLKTWRYLLHKLDVSVNQPSVVRASLWPILESIISKGLDDMRSTSLWTSCLDLLDDHILSKIRAKEQDPSVNHGGSFLDYPIKWFPWEICSLEFFLKMVSLILTQGSVMKATSENRNLAFSYSLRIFRSVLRGVEIELKLMSANYDRVQFCITTILTFLKEISEDVALKYRDEYCYDFLLVVFQFVEAIIEELDSLILASPLYRVKFDLRYINEMQLSENEEKIEVDILKISSLVSKDTVSPMVYITILDLCLMTQSFQNLLLSQTDGFSRAIKHIKCLLFSANPKLYLQAAICFLYMHLGESVNRKFSLLMTWSIIVQSLHQAIECASLPFSGSECDNSSCTVIFQLLCCPFIILLHSPEVSVHKRVSCNSDVCLVSSHREIQMENLIEVWKSFFDFLSSSTPNKQPFLINNIAESLCQILIRVLDERNPMAVQKNAQISSWNSPNIDFLIVFGEIVICILGHAQVLYVKTLGAEAISQEGSSQNHGRPISKSLVLVARFMMMSVNRLETNPHAANMVICRVFSALTCLLRYVCSKQDVLRLTELISDPFVEWLSWATLVSDETQQRTGIPCQIQRLWAQLLDCLRRSQPPIVFDSLLLGAQASLLRVSLDHPRPAISDAAIAFWNDTYNRNPGLNYPDCLLPILDRLSRSGRIKLQPEGLGKNMAGWFEKKISGAMATEEPHTDQRRVVETMNPGFKRRRLKVPWHDLGEFDCWEGGPEHRKVDCLLKKLRREKPEI